MAFISMNMKGQRSFIIDKMTHFEIALRTRRLVYPIFFHRCLVEMIMFPRSIVLSVKAMYQSAFLGLEFSQNTVVVITIERCINKAF